MDGTSFDESVAVAAKTAGAEGAPPVASRTWFAGQAIAGGEY